MAEFVDNFIEKQRSAYRDAPDPSVNNTGFPANTVFLSMESSVNAIEASGASEEACSFLEAILKSTRKGTQGKTTFPDLLTAMRTFMAEKNSELRHAKEQTTGKFQEGIMEAKIIDISFKIRETREDTANLNGYKIERKMYVDALNKSYADCPKNKQSRFLGAFGAVQEWERNNLK